MKWAISAIASVLFWFPAWAEDVRDKEIMVVDQACVERKIANCIADAWAIPTSSKIACEDKMVSIGAAPKQWFGDAHMCRYTDMAALIETVRTAYEKKSFKNDSEKANNETVKERFKSDLSICKMMAENFPSLYEPSRPENCLKPLAQERLINAVNVELKRLTPGQCTGSKCEELDKVPAQ